MTNDSSLFREPNYEVRVSTNLGYAESIYKLLQQRILESDDFAIADAYYKLKEIDNIEMLSEYEQIRASLACQRQNILLELRESLKSEDVEKVFLLYSSNKTILDSCKNFHSEERYRVRDIWQNILLAQFDKAVQNDNPEEITNIGENVLSSGVILNREQHQAFWHARRTIEQRQNLIRWVLAIQFLLFMQGIIRWI